MRNGVLNMSGPEPPKLPNTSKPAAADCKEKFEYETAIYSVRWSHSLEGQQAAWLASAGQTGIVRCQRVSLNW